jgi:aspartate racemase
MMRTIGLLGGMSWESSAEYYRIINETVRERLGGLHSAECVMYSVDFAAIERLQSEGSWEKATEEMIQAAKHVQDGGADFLVICTNTMHKMAEDVERELRIPLLHIADATAQMVKARGIDKVGLLGTRFTMEEDFYRGRLVQKHDLDVVIPGVNERELVDRVIYDELCLGRIEPSSRKRYVEIIEELIDAGAEGIILGCTEIGLLVHQDDVRVPCFDTARIHAEAAVAYALTG